MGKGEVMEEVHSDPVYASERITLTHALQPRIDSITEQTLAEVMLDLHDPSWRLELRMRRLRRAALRYCEQYVQDVAPKWNAIKRAYGAEQREEG